ncbi:hypothetical protein EON65_19945 [archaeon]|nr:MAG: hypothetical protein EON65_19945 [archaeon]
MPESEEGESEEEEEEDDVDSVGDLVSDDDEEAGEEDAEEIEDGEDLAGSKRKQVKDISKSRKVIKVDGDFQLIKKVNKKGKPKGMK